jgi:hypothetical protein
MVMAACVVGVSVGDSLWLFVVPVLLIAAGIQFLRCADHSAGHADGRMASREWAATCDPSYALSSRVPHLMEACRLAVAAMRGACMQDGQHHDVRLRYIMEASWRPIDAPMQTPGERDVLLTWEVIHPDGTRDYIVIDRIRIPYVSAPLSMSSGGMGGYGPRPGMDPVTQMTPFIIGGMITR